MKDTKWSNVFLVIGLIGFINLISGIALNHPSGYIFDLFGLAVLAIFGANMDFAFTIVFVIFEFWWIWLLVGGFLRHRAKKAALEKSVA